MVDLVGIEPTAASMPFPSTNCTAATASQSERHRPAVFMPVWRMSAALYLSTRDTERDALTAMTLRTARALASSMRRLKETAGLLEAPRATLTNPGAVSEICCICHNPICLETCATDEHGSEVHERMLCRRAYFREGICCIRAFKERE